MATNKSKQFTSSAAKPAFSLRMDEDVRAAAEKACKAEDRSLNWVINDRLRKALGLKSEPSK